MRRVVLTMLVGALLKVAAAVAYHQEQRGGGSQP
jgi:hypothetical protein